MIRKLLLVWLFLCYAFSSNAQDTTPPVINCPADLNVECGNDTSPAATGIATATDDSDPNPVITFSDVFASGCGLTGVLTRTWTATDVSGNSSSCTQIINVVDTTPPVLSCPSDITVECGASGSTTTTGTTTGVNSTSNPIPDNDSNGISVPSFVSGIPTGAILTDIDVELAITHTWVGDLEIELESPSGETLVLMTLPGNTNPTGCCGYSADLLSSSPISFNDAATVNAEQMGATLTGSQVVCLDDGICDYLPNEGPPSSFAQLVSDINTNGSDPNGFWRININDQAAGDFGVLNNVVINIHWTNTIIGGGGTDTSPSTTGTATATDGCGVVTISYTDSSVPTCGNTEIITRTWIATDECGNTSTCDQIITVVDLTPPIIICPAGVVVECGDDTSPAGTGNAIATDGCGTSTITYSDTVIPNCANTETIIREWTATDECGNSSTCIQLIAVVDTTPPVVNCPPDVEIECGDDISPANTGFATGTDSCGTVTFTYSDSSVSSCGSTEIISRTWTGTDECGTSTATCVQIITIVDTTLPVITCPADMTVECGDDTSPANTGSATATDGCGSVVISFSDSSVPGCGSTETITRTWTATDDCGNSISCTQIIIVEDTTPPFMDCPADVTVECGDDTSPTATGTPTGITDTCSGISVGWSDSSAPGCGLTEVITRTWTATDDCGNVYSCTQTITVVDTTPPTITAPPDTTVECGNDTSPAATGTPTGISDTCSGISVGHSDSSVPGCGLTEVITRTWTATDECGNSTQVIQIITVVDTTPPVVSCPPDVTIECGDDISPTNTGTPTASDGCGNVSVTFTDSSVPGCGLTETITRTWTITDDCGNTTSCSQVIMVMDTTPPSITCPSDTIVECNGDTSPSANGVATATDGCGITTITYSDSSVPGCGGTATITRTWTATDECGNSTSCDQIITVVDTTPPVANCPADITVNNDPGTCGAVVTYTVDGSDSCGTVTTTQVSGIPSGQVFPVGVTTNIFNITDECGNTTQCSFTVTVIDNEIPDVTCPQDMVVDTSPGNCYAEVFFPDAIAVDNCGISSVIQTGGIPNGGMFPVGVNTVTFTATDVNGNTNTCSFTITVVDNEPAMAVCMDITIPLDASGNASINPSDVDGGSFDNCGIAGMTVTPSSFTCADVGPNNVILEITDVNGNISTCVAVVTVEDVTPPDAVCTNITVQLDPTGTVTISGSDIDGGSTDACGIASYDLNIDTFTCADVGPNDVILTVTDVNGNTSSCTAIVTVEDVTAPDLVCMDITVELGEDGTAIITADDLIVTNDDACGILTTAIDIFMFDCSDIGTPVTVTVFSMDVNGNPSSCVAMVTVVDLLEPDLTCPPDQTVDPGPSNLFYEVPDYFATGEAFAFDNCTDPVTDTTQDPAAGTLLSDGVYTITCTATDDSGNTAICTFELTIESILGSDDIDATISSIILYPNPATDYVMVSNPTGQELESLTIYDLNGRLIKTVDLKEMGVEKAIDISELASATYMFIIKGVNGQLNKQIIKE